MYLFANKKRWVYNINRVNLENQNMFRGKSDLERNIFTQFYVTTVFYSLHIHTSLTEIFFVLFVGFRSFLAFTKNYLVSQICQLWASQAMGIGAEGQTSRQKHGANSTEAAADKRAGCAFDK